LQKQLEDLKEKQRWAHENSVKANETLQMLNEEENDRQRTMDMLQLTKSEFEKKYQQEAINAGGTTDGGLNKPALSDQDSDLSNVQEPIAHETNHVGLVPIEVPMIDEETGNNHEPVMVRSGREDSDDQAVVDEPEDNNAQNVIGAHDEKVSNANHFMSNNADMDNEDRASDRMSNIYQEPVENAGNKWEIPNG